MHTIGILGGTFDPIHLGHVRLAEIAMDSGLVDEIVLVPTPVNPLKSFRPTAHYEHRRAMVSLTAGLMTKTTVFDGTKFMADTISQLKGIFNNLPLSLILGGDAVKLYEWEKIDQIIDNIRHVIVVPRGPLSKDQLQQLWIKEPDAAYKLRILDQTGSDLSSTIIRNALKAGDMNRTRGFMPTRVGHYIDHHNLYK